MTTAISIIENTASGNLSRNIKLSAPLWTAYRILHRVHRLWYWCGRAEIYTNPDNFLKLAAGHAINWIAGDRSIVRVAAQAVMISTRILMAVKEQTELYHESKQFWKKISDPYVLPSKFKWSKPGNKRLLSPSTINWWKSHYRATIDLVKRIAKALFCLLKRFFTMSMRTMDAIAAFSFNPENRNAAVNEFFINCSKTMELLVNHREILLDCLSRNKKIITQILSTSNSVITVEQLIASVKKTLDATERVNTISQKIGALGRGLLKRITYGLFQTVGMTEYLPANWVPPLRMPDSSDTNPRGKAKRFPSAASVTLITLANDGGGQRALSVLRPRCKNARFLQRWQTTAEEACAVVALISNRGLLGAKRKV